MEPIALTNSNITPDETQLASIIGDRLKYWQQIMQHLASNYEHTSEVWRFYNDGKCWLFRTLRKKETIFWCGVYDGGFRVTFYFSDKIAHLIEESDLPLEVREEFATAKKFSTTRPVTINVTSDTDVFVVFRLISLKIKGK